MAAHVLGICPLVKWNPKEDEHIYPKLSSKSSRFSSSQFESFRVDQY